MYRNEPWSAIIHLIGTLLAITGLVLLVVFAAIKATAWHVVTFSIFGASMVLLYLASTLYHFFFRDKKTVKEVFRRIDHSMIFVLIAGTYTPICLVSIRGGWGWSFFGIIWALAATGISLKSSGVKMSEWFSTTLYVLMGWLIVIAVYPLSKSLPLDALILLLLGGVFYSVGAVFYYIDSKVERKKAFWLHEMFHLFVIAGTLSHFGMMWKFVL